MASLMLFKLQPKTLLIGIDSYGTRVIETKDDRLIRMERHNFMKKFITLLYHWDASTFSQNISTASDLMAIEIWEKRKGDFQKIGEEMKTKPFQQKVDIEEIREIDVSTYQVDLHLTIQRGLMEKKMPLRVEIHLRSSHRSGQNIYPYEVSSYDEQVQ